ncbi:hypothetical protein DPMN_175345 [Dreissena polymorpha]|uniref:Uncharacterized protein n=1 Tax=Dreissena polymorpha TaxID=45954 RepID=A0A9D4II50_DREPO|nr:hypothetical protein DPMN_175345 [Dreissena polymorpha]
MLFQTVTLSSSWREQRIILGGCSAPCDVSLATKSPTCALHTSGCSDFHDHRVYLEQRYSEGVIT